MSGDVFCTCQPIVHSYADASGAANDVYEFVCMTKLSFLFF